MKWYKGKYVLDLGNGCTTLGKNDPPRGYNVDLSAE